MTALTRTDKALDDLFEDFFRPAFFRRLARLPAGAEAPAEIRIDVHEDDKGYDVRAEVPGLKKEDIRISIDGNVVSISSEVRKEKQTTGDGKRVLCKELYWGSSARSFTLPHEVDAKAAIAKLDDGVLTLRLPRSSEGASRTLKIE